MTAPGFRYPDYNAQLGTESALARSEWDTFLRRRKELVDSIAGRLQLQSAIGPAAASQVANQTEVDQGIAAARLAPPNVEELNKLIGAAQYYGIQGADKLPPDKLKMIVEQRRMAYQKAQKPINQRTLGEHVARTLVEDMAVFGLGATESLMRTAVRIPFIGDAIQKQAGMQEAQQWFGSMNEGVLASMPQGQSQVHRVFRGAGAMVAYTLPATAAYRALGLVGSLPSAIAIGSRMSPLARAAIAELGTAWALEGGGEASLEERAQNVALSAGFGTALRSIPFIAQRIRDRFSPNSGPVGGVAAPGGGFRERPGVVGQEVSGQAVEVPVLEAGQRALPPGPRPQIEGPGIETPFAPRGGPGTVVADYTINPQNLGNRGNLLPAPRPSAVAMTKEATIMESPTLAQVAHEADIDESTVARASLASHPGQISVVQGVGDIGKTVRGLIAAQNQGKLLPHQFRVVQRGESTDLLISEGLPITNKRVAQYQAHGMFEGQLATSSMGNDVRVINPAGEFATVQSIYGGENYFVPREMLMPGKATVGGEEVLSSRSAAVTWERFKQFATKRLADEGQRAGLPGFNWNDGQVSTQLPRLIGEFLSGQKMKPGERMAMEAYFDHVRVREFQSLAPQEMGVAHAINRELNTAVVKASPHLAKLPMEDIAATKGFGYIANPGGQGGTLVDQLSDLRVDVGSEGEALEFVRDFRREVPDYTPVTDVPMEAMPQHPMAANPGIDLEPVHRGGEAAVAAGVRRTLRQVEQSTSVSPTPPSSLSPPAAPPASPPPSPPPPPSLGAPNPGGGFFPTGRPSPVPSLGAEFATARAERPAELHAMLEELDSVWLRYGAPFRSFTLQVQQKLTNIGITEGKLWKHYYDLTTAVTQVHNESRPWHSEWNNIMTQFGRKKRRDGTVLRIEEIGDYNQKIAAMQAAGYSQREMAAQGRIRGFFDRLHDEAGISNYIFSYVPKVRQRQAMGVRDPYSDEGLPPTVQFFAEFARTGNLQMRQQDMGVLGTTWIRAWQFKKHAEGPWNQMVTAWQDPRVPEELRQIATNWLNIVRTGYNQSYDPLVQGIRHTLNKNGIPITDAEVAGMWNTIFSNMYRGALGGRPDVIFRDATGPLFTGARIGMTPVAEVYTRFIRGGGRARDEMWDRALKGGWVEAGQVRSVNAETFTQPLVTDAGTSLLSPGQQARRETFARIGDFVHDMLPPSWRNGIQGSKFDPLFYYTKLGEFNRLISGEAGWQVASKAIANYEAAVSKLVRAEQARSSALGSRVPQRGVPAFEQAMDKALAKLMDDSKALVYRPPVQQEFKRLIQASDYEGAANLLANEAANMQFRYGMKENPIGVREAGNTGRMAMMYGTFTQQYVSFMRESLASHVPVKDRAAFLARYAGITGAIGLAGAYTGWNFSKWMWHQSLTFAGGPMFQGAVKLAQAGAGVVTSIMGNEPNPDQAAAMRSMNPYELIPTAVGSLFPYRSTFNTLNSYEQAMNNLNPGESMIRQTLTGDPTMRTDLQRFFQNQQAFMPVQTPPAAAISGAPTSALPAPQMQQLGVTDSSKVRLHTNGYPVYDTDRKTSDGKSPTHRLDVPSGRGPDESWEQYEDRVNAAPITSFSVSDWRANSNPGDLDPDVRTPLMQMIAAAAGEGHKLSINETYRPPSRQELLFKQGRSLPGNPVTWTLTSDHATRRAADLRASGQAGYVWIQENGPRFGFKVLGMFDPGHVSIPLPAQGGAPQVAGGAQRQLSGAGAQQ